MSSYFSLSDEGSKAYCRRKTLSPFIIDANTCSLMQIIDHIAEHFMWEKRETCVMVGTLNVMLEL
jgi:hypothetical protein